MGSDTSTSQNVYDTSSVYNLDNHQNVNLSDEQTFNNKAHNDNSFKGNQVNGNVDNMQGLSNSASGTQVFKLVNLRSLNPASIALLNLDSDVQNVSNQQNIVNNHDFTHNGLLVKGNYHDIQDNQNFGLQTIAGGLILL